jgi:peroxiredoxin
MERADATRFLEEYPADFTIVYDENQQLARQYGVVAMPSSFVIGRDGQVAATHMGFKVKKQDEYEALIVKALQEPGAAR